MELLDASIIETDKFPETVDLVFSESMVGAIGVVYTFTVESVAVAFPVGLVRRIYNEYTFPINGICEFPVLLMVNLYVVLPLGATPEFP